MPLQAYCLLGWAFVAGSYDDGLAAGRGTSRPDSEAMAELLHQMVPVARWLENGSAQCPPGLPAVQDRLLQLSLDAAGGFKDAALEGIALTYLALADTWSDKLAEWTASARLQVGIPLSHQCQQALQLLLPWPSAHAFAAAIAATLSPAYMAPSPIRPVF